jgi:putative DNA primase/helicase
MHQEPDRLRQKIIAYAGQLAGKGSNSAQARAAEPLAIVYVAGLFGIEFGLLPLAEDALQEAVQWAWHQFHESREASVLDPATQVVPNIRRYLAERWDVTCKPVDAGNPSARSAVALSGHNNREAVAWYDETTV